MYKEIRRAAYHLADAAEPWTEDFRALPFPEHWHEGLLELHNYGRSEGSGTRRFPRDAWTVFCKPSRPT